jgi:xanthine dehydrogenase accessory factor
MLQKILEICCEGIASGKRYSLATVVMATGSSYRGLGARLLIDEQLNTIGEVSGGCLDEDVLNHGREVMSDQQPRLRVYDTRFGSDTQAICPGPGPGCVGLTKVLIEPLTRKDIPMLSRMLELVKNRTPFLLASAFDGKTDGALRQGTLGVFSDTSDTGIIRNFTDDVLDKLRRSKLAESAMQTGYAYMYLPEKMSNRTILLERVEPQQELLIVGTGDDVLPVLQFTEVLGWRCIVADHRTERFAPVHFKRTTNIVVNNYSELISIAKPDPGAFVLIMTHNYFSTWKPLPPAWMLLSNM